MRILGIDPGFERVGIAVIERHGQDDELVYSDCFTTSSRDPFPERLEAIGHEITKIIKSHKPEVLAIETVIFNTNQKTAMRVAEMRGAALYCAKRSGLRVNEYTPLQVKIALTGYGKAPKEQVAQMVRKIIRLEESRRFDDELDAIAIALCHHEQPSG